MENIYEKFGIDKKILDYSENILAGLKERFEEIDAVAEYNQAKVIKAMQDNRVDAQCFAGNCTNKKRFGRKITIIP